ncbi:MAG: hypothetical protein JO103_05310 [Candidatus Eremiobacteraeota bacterium]|nr:hypothetical protein [Candidatus Eremiobacteraeota bacterium]
MERRDVYQDDHTEERYPSPARRDDEAASQTLDPDVLAGDDEDEDEDEDEDDELDDELND